MSTTPTPSPEIEPWIDLRDIRSRDSQCTRKSESRNTSINLAYKDRHALLDQVTQHRVEFSRLRTENEALRAKLEEAERRAVNWRQPEELRDPTRSGYFIIKDEDTCYGHPFIMAERRMSGHPDGLINWCYESDLLATLPANTTGAANDKD